MLIGLDFLCFFVKNDDTDEKKKKQNLRLFLNIISWVSLLHDSRVFILNKSYANIGRYQRIDYFYNYLFVKKYTETPLPPHLVTRLDAKFVKNLILFTTINTGEEYLSGEVSVSPRLPNEILVPKLITPHFSTPYTTNMSALSSLYRSMILLTINQLL